jgi:hypothetical protein
MKIIKELKYIIILCLIVLTSCEEFVEVDAPNNRIVSEFVFEEEASARSAMQGIYNELFRLDFSSGFQNSITNLAGLSADNLEVIRPTNATFLEFQENEILPDNNRNLAIWSSAYNMIYMTNALLEGLRSSKLPDEIISELDGQARFVRAFTYFYMVNLYGDVPLILSTDYNYNATASRSPVQEVYDQILYDLEEAIALLPETYLENERIYANKYAALSLLARTHLYLENWELAEEYSSQVILQQQSYELLDDPNEVFLKNSREAIWQISPLGRGNSATQTNEGALYLIEQEQTSFYNLSLTEDLVEIFDESDERYMNWIDYSETEAVFFAQKYKDRNSTNNLTEYSMVFRLAELYLIRAESRFMMGKTSLAIEDLNIIRRRAGIEEVTNSNWTVETFQKIILEERRREFFTEWGHRWLDLKRIGLSDEILSLKKEFWEATDILYPIPAEERMKNTNLTQNNGY